MTSQDGRGIRPVINHSKIESHKCYRKTRKNTMGFQRREFASNGEFGEVFLERVAFELECECW